MSSIQWFPLHMHKAKLAIAKLLPNIDVIIELLDARIPLSSCNPILQDMIKRKPNIRLLNKSDLADDAITKLWLDYFHTLTNTHAITGYKDDKQQRNRLIKLCRSLAPNRNCFEKPLRVMIIGIPNVGKSTLVNQLLAKNSAKTMDMPASTRANQCLTLADDFLLYDTPGITWQKFSQVQIGYNLALCNSISRRALDEETLALYLLAYLPKHYPNQLALRYKLALDTKPASALPNSPTQWFNLIGSKRGCLLAAGKLDRQKTAEIIINDFRQGKLGQISLETPPLLTTVALN